MKKFLFAALLAMLVCSCSTADVRYITIASERGYMCDGESGMLNPCFLVKDRKGDNWDLEYGLEFNGYERGYEFEVEAEEIDKIPQEKWYRITHIISKKKKTSANLPNRLYDENWPRMTCEEFYKKYGQ